MNKLTRKQRGFVKDYVETGNGTQSALKNYDTKDYMTANQIAVENLQKPAIQNAIKSIAEQIPDELLVQVHLEGLNASRTIKTEDDEIVEPDYAVRHKYLDTAHKLKGTYAPDRSLNLNVNLDNGLTDEEKEGLRKLLKQ